MRTIQIYRIIRIDAEFDPKQTSQEDAANEAIERCMAEAASNGLYEGLLNGVKINDVTDCGESI